MIGYITNYQPSAIGAGQTKEDAIRDGVYYAQVAGLKNTDTRGLVKGFQAFGNSAFTPGEIQGVIEDLGRAIAYVMLNGIKVHINGLGTFSPKLVNSKSNIKVESEINSRSFTCDVNFDADSEFKGYLSTAEWQKMKKEQGKVVADNDYAMRFRENAGNAGLQFITDPAIIMQNWAGAASATASINGGAPINCTLGTSGLLVPNAIPSGQVLTDATVVISVSTFSYSDADDTVTVPAKTFTVQHVSQSNNVGGTVPTTNGENSEP